MVDRTPSTIVILGAAFPFEGMLPFESVEYLTGASIVWLCGMNQTPIQDNMLEKLAIKDLFVSLATKKSVYISLHRSYLDMLKKYYYEHYGVNVLASLVFKANSFDLYKITIETKAEV